MKSLCIAFSMFSKLPVPQFEWDKKDMKYMIVFFPFVGIVIGVLTYLWGMVYQIFSISGLSFALIGTAIPLIVSGGIHVDGYVDTVDALHSFKEKEKKLEILKDPHIGAFGVIHLILYYLIYAGAYGAINGQRAVLLLGIGYWLSRILSAIGVVTFPCAKEDGLGYLFSSQADKKKTKVYLYAQLLICTVLLLYISVWIGGIVLIVSGFTLGRYYKKCNKEFGGVTGDTSGYFTTLCEGAVILMVAAGCMFKLI